MADERPVNGTFDVTLQEAVQVDGAPVTQVVLRRPNVGQLRGLSVNEIMQLDVAAMLKLLPRISAPPLSAAALEGMDPADFAELSIRASLFFVKRRAAEAAEAPVQDD